MEIFISWSGEASKLVGLALRDWLPSVIQAVRPWMSDEDLKKGARWGTALAERLESTDFGICCLTPYNLESRWLHFEAGALAKRVTAAHVCPYLFHVEPADLEGPYREFQLTRAEREDTRKLLRTLNGTVTEGPLSEAQLDKAFEKWWPDLEERLRSIPLSQVKEKPRRQLPEMVEEILELVRGLARGQDEAARAAIEAYKTALAQRFEELEKGARAELARVASGLRSSQPPGISVDSDQVARSIYLSSSLADRTAHPPDLSGLDESSAQKKEPTD